MRNLIFFILIVSFLQGCIDPFEVETRGFEGVLVVDAKLTDEAKRQRVLLSRARPFENDTIIPEKNAIVKISSASGMSYDFVEVGSGVYESVDSFGAITEELYELQIITVEGASFSSEPTKTPTPNDIVNVTAKRLTKGDGDEGIGILVDTENLTNNEAFLRFEYEEDFKVIAPFWSPFEFDIISDDLCSEIGLKVDIKPNRNNNRICYGHSTSTDILLANSEQLDSNDLSKFRVRFIDRDNYILSHRYSILVKQISLSGSAYAYYESLESFSSNEDVFTSVQPGFLEGNLKAGDGKTKVIGLFEVSSVRSERLFLDYDDFFDGETLPPYPSTCNTGSPALIPAGAYCHGGVISAGTEGSPLIDGIRAGIYTYYGDYPITPERIAANDGEIAGLGPYWTKPAECGDCTKLGSNTKPEFWIE